MRISDWSSDVCSSDLGLKRLQRHRIVARDPARGIPRARLELGLYLIFGLEPTDEHVQLELADDTHDHIGAYFGIEDLDDPLLGHVVERLPQLLGLGRIDERDAARSEEHTSELQSLMRISYAV